MLTVLGFEYEGSEQGKNGQLIFHREEDLVFRPMGFECVSNENPSSVLLRLAAKVHCSLPVCGCRSRKVLLTDVQNTEMELLTMLVGGDTFHCIIDELRSPQLRSRPLALDLLWAVSHSRFYSSVALRLKGCCGCKPMPNAHQRPCLEMSPSCRSMHENCEQCWRMALLAALKQKM